MMRRASAFSPVNGRMQPSTSEPPHQYTDVDSLMRPRLSPIFFSYKYSPLYLRYVYAYARSLSSEMRYRRALYADADAAAFIAV